MDEEIHNRLSTSQHSSTMTAVTLHMILDYLDTYEVLSQPKRTEREFSSIVPVSKRDPQLFIEAPDEKNALYVCHSENAEKVLKEHREIFVLALTREQSLPEWVSRYASRVLLVRSQENFSYFNFLLQRYFIHITVWEHELDNAVLRKSELNELLNVGSTLTGNFMTVNDNQFNLVGYTDVIEPPDNVSKYLIEEGCLPEPRIDTWKRKILEKRLMREEATEALPFVQYHHPIYVDHVYFASIVMICNGTVATKGLEDIFMKIVKRVTELCQLLWKKQAQTDFPFYSFFIRLIQGTAMSPEYIKIQTSLGKIPHPAEFKLIALETGTFNKATMAEQINTAASQLNRHACYCFPFEDKLVVLYYSQPSESNLSHHKTFVELEEKICKPFGIDCGVSQVFIHLEDLDMAYKQTCIALKLKDTIRRELFVVGEEQNKSVFLFEEALLSYLVSQQQLDERFLKFTFSHTIVEKLYAEDQKNGTNYLALFWFYIHHERNATLVAQRLHMHRNTVLYHIEKIQNRFDFDLATQSALERMRIDFKTFFLNQSNETIDSIFEGVEENNLENPQKE